MSQSIQNSKNFVHLHQDSQPNLDDFRLFLPQTYSYSLSNKQP